MDPMVIITDNARDFPPFCLSVPSTIHPMETSGSTMHPMKTRGKVKVKLNPGIVVEKKEGKAVKKTRPQQFNRGVQKRVHKKNGMKVTDKDDKYKRRNMERQKGWISSSIGLHNSVRNKPNRGNSQATNVVVCGAADGTMFVDTALSNENESTLSELPLYTAPLGNSHGNIFASASTREESTMDNENSPPWVDATSHSSKSKFTFSEDFEGRSLQSMVMKLDEHNLIL